MQTRAHSCSAAGLSFQGIAATVAAAALVAATFAQAQPNPDHPHGSRAPAVHRIPLVNGEKTPGEVKPDAAVPVPFSYANTCGQCHDKQNQIRKGWHFNATPAQKQSYSVTPSGSQKGAVYTLTLTGPDGTSAGVSYTATEQKLRAVVQGLRQAVQAAPAPWTLVTAGGDDEKLILTAKEVGQGFQLEGDAKLVEAPAATPATGAATRPAAAPAGKVPQIKVDPLSAARPAPLTGRPGEPWILADRVTGTQLPLSYRPWQGLWSPRDIGMTNWRFTQKFGRQLPGGGVGLMDGEKDTETDQRWEFSGTLEINCQACHSHSPRENMSLWALNVDQQSFRWAGAAASPFAVVSGSVVSIPEAAMPEDPETVEKMPKTSYNRSEFMFNPNRAVNEVFFDTTNRMPAERCAYCHSTHEAGQDAPHLWETDRDVHLASGLTCVDCHRNGLDHNMVRGYEREKRDDDAARTLTCRGCHYGKNGVGAKMQGRLGAPYPEHRGLPTVHLEKISCTGCHSGPWPTAQVRLVQTARAHALGVHEKHSADPLLPLISTPVFLKGHDGKIAPHYTMYPAFWARLKDDKVAPINPAEVAEAGKAVLPFVKPKQKLEEVPLPTPEQIEKVMVLLNARKSDAGEVVYVSGGKLYRLDANKNLAGSSHASAQPYSWPMAHDVRPAGRALGANGCADCHTTEAAIFFGKVKALAPVQIAAADEVPMYQLQGADGTYWANFARSFVFRPMLKTVGLVCSGIIGLIVLAFLVKAAIAVTRRFAPASTRRD